MRTICVASNSIGRLWYIILALAFYSCTKENENKEPYFKFDSVGEALLSGIRVGDTMKFAGSNGSYRQYAVFSIEKTKQTIQDCSFISGVCTTYYHYDLLRIHYIRTDTTPPSPNAPLTYTLTKQMQLPLNVDEKNLPKDVQARAVIYGTLVDFNAIPPSSPGWSAPYQTYPDFYQSLALTTYSNSVKTYTEVVIIKSGNNSVYVDPLYGNKYTVNEVWFDKKYGLVYFKDVFGNSWNKTN